MTSDKTRQRVLQAISQVKPGEYVTRYGLRTALGLSDAELTPHLHQLALAGVITRTRLRTSGRPWGYAPTLRGRVTGAEATTDTAPTDSGYRLDDAILKLLLSRIEMGTYEIDEIGIALIIPAGVTVTSDAIMAVCNDLMERGLVELWGEPSDEISLRLPLPIDMDGKRCFPQQAKPTTEGKYPGLDALAEMPQQIRQLREERDAAKALAKDELEKRHAAERDRANDKAVYESALRRLNELGAKLTALDACYRGLFFAEK